MTGHGFMIVNFFQLLQPGLDVPDMRFADAPEIRLFTTKFFHSPLPDFTVQNCSFNRPATRLLPVCGQRLAVSLKHTLLDNFTAWSAGLRLPESTHIPNAFKENSTSPRGRVLTCADTAPFPRLQWQFALALARGWTLDFSQMDSSAASGDHPFSAGNAAVQRSIFAASFLAPDSRQSPVPRHFAYPGTVRKESGPSQTQTDGLPQTADAGPANNPGAVSAFSRFSLHNAHNVSAISLSPHRSRYAPTFPSPRASQTRHGKQRDALFHLRPASLESTVIFSPRRPGTSEVLLSSARLERRERASLHPPKPAARTPGTLSSHVDLPPSTDSCGNGVGMIAHIGAYRQQISEVWEARPVTVAQTALRVTVSVDEVRRSRTAPHPPSAPYESSPSSLELS
ncbi:hypothetical protein CMUS01_10625 [Colletotrichum musicola]|uniref:Uncharacterized protein n=1 Tax=Colletotrichum musicola TaxID=2175873 RepID=A0A8H6K1Z3_9PEZI|nr:hypothetical protein CMUS01_10625 [Colletotrichum musicola]